MSETPTYQPADLKRIREGLELDQEAMGARLGVSREMVSKMENSKKPITKKTAILLYQIEQASELKPQNGEKSLRKIPFYGDVASIGGKMMAANNVASSPTAYINPGDWFPGATAACRHYGESMLEYPNGCILVLKEIKDLRNGIIPGQNYVIEYGDDRNSVTKRLQFQKEKIIAYSSNPEMYQDGSLIHQPFPIHKLHRAFLILGHIMMGQTSGIMIVGAEHEGRAAVSL